jgi:hypothetical protein
MEASKDEELRRAVATLAGFIDLTESCGLDDTARFLAMARLSLLMELNGISEHELRAFSEALEPGAANAPMRVLPGTTAMQPNEVPGEPITRRRAVLRPAGMASPRGRRAQMKT